MIYTFAKILVVNIINKYNANIDKLIEEDKDKIITIEDKINAFRNNNQDKDTSSEKLSIKFES